MECVKNNILRGPRFIPSIDKRGLGSYIFDQCEKHRNKIFQVDADTGTKESFGSVKKRSVSVAVHLSKRGIKPGDIVSICTNNILDNIIVFNATLFVGATVASLDPSMTPKELTYLIKLVEPKLLFVQDKFLETIEQSITNIENIPDIVVIGHSNRYTAFTEFLKEDCSESQFRPKVIDDIKSERAAILFSSGSTGFSKGICLSHYSLMMSTEVSLLEYASISWSYFYASYSSIVDNFRRTLNTWAIVRISHVQHTIFLMMCSCIYLGKGFMFNFIQGCFDAPFRYQFCGDYPKVYFHMSTMFWISAVMLAMWCFAHGSCKILTENMGIENILHILQKYKVEFSFLPSFTSHTIITYPRTSEYDFSSLKYLLFSGAGLPVSRIIQCRSLMRNNNLYLGYGMTELAGFISTFIGADKELILRKPGASGTAAPNTMIKVTDMNSGMNLGCKQMGEIRVKSPSIMLGYLKRDCSVEFDEEGYLKTGDIGYYDEDRCIYVVSRIKEKFTYQTNDILPAVIEAELLKNEAIKEAIVYGIPDEVNENLPAACVVLKEYKTALEEELLEFVNKRVSDKEKLRGGLKIVDSIPKTPTGKVNRLKFLQEVYDQKQIK